MFQKLFGSYKIILLYGLSLAGLLFLMRWLEFRLLIIDHTTELYAGAIAVVFLILGIWLAKHLSKPKTVLIEKTVYVDQSENFVRNEKAVEKLGLSKRELEVLELIAQGLSNNEIAARLFVSLNTIKTHSSKLFEKLEVSRRTQAVEVAKRIGIIPL
nr:LuxR C-terminal-related transcriptional regulator [uncultured Fluviicola sp.]